MFFSLQLRRRLYPSPWEELPENVPCDPDIYGRLATFLTRVYKIESGRNKGEPSVPYGWRLIAGRLIGVVRKPAHVLRGTPSSWRMPLCPCEIASSSSNGGGGGVDISTELADKVYSLWGSSVRDQFASDNAHLTGASDAKQNPSAFGILARSVTESSQHNRELLSKFDLLERKFEVTQAALLRSLHSPNIRTKTTRRALSITSFHIRR